MKVHLLVFQDKTKREIKKNFFLLQEGKISPLQYLPKNGSEKSFAIGKAFHMTSWIFYLLLMKNERVY
jgi:hypothetical protein